MNKLLAVLGCATLSLVLIFGTTGCPQKEKKTTPGKGAGKTEKTLIERTSIEKTTPAGKTEKTEKTTIEKTTIEKTTPPAPKTEKIEKTTIEKTTVEKTKTEKTK